MFTIPKCSMRQMMTIFPAAMEQMLFGFVFGWIDPAITYFKSDHAPYIVTETDISWIASMYFFAEVGSAIFNGMFTKKLGRKPMLMFSSFLVALAWGVQMMATSSSITILSRAIHGIAAGTHDAVWGIYVGEVTTAAVRGYGGSIMSSVFLGGIMLQFILSLYVPFVYLSTIPFVLAIVAFVLMCFIVEAPHYLLTNGKDEAASKNLAWLRGHSDPKMILEEFMAIKHHIEVERGTKGGLKKLITSPAKHKVDIVGILIFTLAQPSGNIAILSFQTILLEQFENFPSGETLTLLYAVLQFIFINLSPWLIENVGRKGLLIVGFGSSAIIQLALSVVFLVEELKYYAIPHVPYVICGLFNVYGVIFAMCVFPTVYVLKSELFSLEMKSVANCSSTVTNAFADFIVVKLFVWIWRSYGLYVNFVVYSIISVFGVFYVYMLIPETKGKTLVEIQEKIKRNSQKRNFDLSHDIGGVKV